jgi:hypothetical protein
VTHGGIWYGIVVAHADFPFGFSSGQFESAYVTRIGSRLCFLAESGSFMYQTSAEDSEFEAHIPHDHAV